MVLANDFLGASEQRLFLIEDSRQRADALQKLLVPKLETLLQQACNIVREVYGADVLLPYRVTTTPAHRPGAKETKLFEKATAGLAVKGKHWYFQQRIECTVDGLYVNFFGLRGLEGNPIVRVMKKNLKSVVDLINYGEFEIFSDATESEKSGELELDVLIDRLRLVPERDWRGTHITGSFVNFPIKTVDASQTLIDDFVTLFPIFRAATDVFLDKDDHFENYLECFRNWQSQPLHQQSTDNTSFFPDEVDSAQTFREGSVRQISVNAYERDPKARQRCIDCYGASCSVCGFDFGKAFGQLGEGFIHVHHLRPISDIAEEYEVDPIKDLRPVCPNCHAMIHRRSPPLSIEEIKSLLRQVT